MQVDEATKGTVLSAFYWGYGISQVGTLLPTEALGTARGCSAPVLQAQARPCRTRTGQWEQAVLADQPTSGVHPHKADCCIMGASLPKLCPGRQIVHRGGRLLTPALALCTCPALSPQRVLFCHLQVPAPAAHQQHADEASARCPAASLQLLLWLQTFGTRATLRCHSHPMLVTSPALRQAPCPRLPAVACRSLGALQPSAMAAASC